VAYNRSGGIAWGWGWLTESGRGASQTGTAFRKGAFPLDGGNGRITLASPRPERRGFTKAAVRSLHTPPAWLGCRHASAPTDGRRIRRGSSNSTVVGPGFANGPPGHRAQRISSTIPTLNEGRLRGDGRGSRGATAEQNLVSAGRGEVTRKTAAQRPLRAGNEAPLFARGRCLVATETA